MNKKFILLSVALLTSPVFAAQQSDAELKKEKSEAVNGNGGAPTGNLMQAITRIETTYAQEAANDAKLAQLLDKEDVEDLLGQAKTLIPMLATNPGTKKFIGDLDALLPQNEALARQLPDFIKACSEMRPAVKFGRDMMKVCALVQMKNSVANPSQAGQMGNANAELLKQLLEAKKKEESKRCIVQ